MATSMLVKDIMDEQGEVQKTAADYLDQLLREGVGSEVQRDYRDYGVRRKLARREQMHVTAEHVVEFPDGWTLESLTDTCNGINLAHMCDMLANDEA